MRARRAGFTLIELMVVIAIIGLIATIAVVNVNEHLERAARQRALQDIRVIHGAIRLYKADLSRSHGRTPASLAELFKNGSPIADKTSPDELLDSWGRPYVYVPGPDGTWDIYSFANDGAPGGTGWAADIHLKEALTQARAE